METVETINQRLIDHFGVDSNNGMPIFRVVWANDQTEKRMMAFSDAGVELLYPEVREVKKYPYIDSMYVLERLVIIPPAQQYELAGEKLSYEPVWTYHDADGNPLPPIWTVTKIVVDTLYAALGKSSLHKYVDPEADKELRIDKIQEELFGNDTSTGDALSYGDGVTVPHNYEKGE